MRFLFIAHRIPFPPNKGDKIRSFHELGYLACLGEVYLAALVDEPGDFAYKKDLLKICREVLLVPVDKRLKRVFSLLGPLAGRPMSVAYFYDSALQGKIDRLLERLEFDGIFCFSATSAEYVLRSPVLDGGKRPRLVMDFCDVDSHKWFDYSRSQSWPLSWLYRFESWLLKRYEKRVATVFDHSILISAREIALFEKLHPGMKPVVEIGNGVDLDYFNPASVPLPSKSEVLEIVFTGAMDYYVNIEGVLWFVEAIWPLIRKELPDAVFTIVGSNPAPEITRLNDHPSIEVTGFVDDVRPYYARATVCVAPLRIARGVQNKVLEAMAMGRAVVATGNAFEGIRAVAGEDLMVCDSEPDFARAVIELVRDREKRAWFEKRSRVCMEKHYRWSENLSRLGLLFNADPAVGNREAE